MRRAKFIAGFVIHEVMATKDYRYVSRYSERPLAIASDGECLLSPEGFTVDERVVPITQFCRPGRPDLYVAYSEEVEDLLGIPIRCILREKDEARAALSAAHAVIDGHNSLSAWGHLKLAWCKLRRH